MNEGKSKFVNYQKRGFTLPAGCKDLGDLLRPRLPGPNVAGGKINPIKPQCSGFAKGTSADIEKNVATFLGSKAEFLGMGISDTEDRIEVFLSRRGAEAPLYTEISLLVCGKILMAKNA